LPSAGTGKTRTGLDGRPAVIFLNMRFPDELAAV
jgi:hypothetical protein